MVRYHFIHVLRWPLFLVIGLFSCLTIWAYRQGGVETGPGFAYFQILRYWATMTPLLTLGLVVSTPPYWFASLNHDPLVLARPTPYHALQDCLARLAAMLTPVVLCGIGASCFLSTRVSDATGVGALAIHDPVTLQSVWLVFLIGPLAGSAALVALSELIGTLLVSKTLRIVVVGMFVFMDALNYIGNPWLSVSGTSMRLAQSPCCAQLMPLGQDQLFGKLFMYNGYWGKYILDHNDIPVLGPITVEPTFSLIIARVVLFIIALGMMCMLSLIRTKYLHNILLSTSHQQQ